MNDFYNGIKKSIPIGLGYLAVSFTFGIYCVNNGLSALAATIMSLTNLSSTGQFVGVDLIIRMASYFELALVVFVVNLRYILMSISMSQHLESDVRLRDKIIFSFAITDEIYAVAIKEKKKINAKFMFGMMILPILGWTLGTLLGAIASNIFPTRISASFNIALYAMFISAFFPEVIKNFKIAFVVLTSIVLSCLFYYIPFLNENISSGFKIIIIAIFVCSLAALIFPKEEDKEEEQ